MGRLRKIFSITLVVILLFSLIGCSSGRKSYETATSTDRAVAPEEAKSDYDYGEAEGGFSNSESEVQYDKASNENSDESLNKSNRKIIKSGHMEVETLTFDETIDTMIRRLEAIGGYVEYSNITGKRINYQGVNERRSANFRLRIPEKHFQEYIREIGNLGNVVREGNDSDDITGAYFDNEARLKSLEIQEERLLEILKKAEDVKDIIELERELSDLRYRIENLTGTIRKWDNLISYSTLEVSLSEVFEIKEVKPVPTTLGQRMKDGFANSIEVLGELGEGFMVLISSLLPFMILILPLIIILLIVYKKFRRKNDKNDENIEE